MQRALFSTALSISMIASLGCGYSSGGSGGPADTPSPWTGGPSDDDDSAFEYGAEDIQPFAWPEGDLDGDGWTVQDGDCDDDDPLVHPGAPGTISVPADYTEIQVAVYAAANGDVICVDPGTYFETLSFRGKAVRIIGTAGPEATVIDAGDTKTVVRFNQGESALSVLEGFTLTRGRMGAGGGIYIYSASPTLRNLIIEGNHCQYNGGGIYMWDSSAMLDGLVIRDNTAGMVGGGIMTNESSPTVINTIITDNRSHAHGGGGYFFRGAPYLENVMVTGNGARVEGGGLYLATDSACTLINLTIVGNRSNLHGGGIYAINNYSCLNDVLLSDNQSAAGGAVYGYNSYLYVSFSNVWLNVPDAYSGMVDPTGVDGNIAVDPQLLDTSSPDPEDWDLHLASSSPLIDAGDVARVDPDASRSDIGAYGGFNASRWDLDSDGYPEWWQPGPYDPGTYPGLGWDCDDQDATVFPGSGC